MESHSQYSSQFDDLDEGTPEYAEKGDSKKMNSLTQEDEPSQ